MNQLGQDPVQEAADEGQVLDLEPGHQEFGQDGQQGQVDRADQGDAGQDVVDGVRGVLARPDARDEPAVLAQVVGHVGRVEDDRDVEVGEEDDGRDVEQVVERHAQVELPGDGLQGRDLDHLGDRRRDGDDRGGEDDRDDAAGVDPQGQVGALAAVDLAADDALGVGHRDAALAPLDEDDEGDDDDHHRAQDDDLDRVPGARSSGPGPCRSGRPGSGPRCRRR